MAAGEWVRVQLNPEACVKTHLKDGGGGVGAPAAAQQLQHRARQLPACLVGDPCRCLQQPLLGDPSPLRFQV